MSASHQLTSGSVVEINSTDEFEKYRDNPDNMLVVVDFFAEWCAPCKVIKPAFEDLAKNNTDVYFVKVDVDSQEEVAAMCDVTCMPTFNFYKGGKLVHTFSGANSDALKKHVLEQKKK